MYPGPGKKKAKWFIAKILKHERAREREDLGIVVPGGGGGGGGGGVSLDLDVVRVMNGKGKNYGLLLVFLECVGVETATQKKGGVEGLAGATKWPKAADAEHTIIIIIIIIITGYCFGVLFQEKVKCFASRKEYLKVIKFHIKSKKKTNHPLAHIQDLFFSIYYLNFSFSLNKTRGRRQQAALTVNLLINSSSISSNHLPVSPKISSAYPNQSPCTNFSSPTVLSLVSICSKR